MSTVCETTDLLVFSHLRWDFVFQRPQHILSRHAKYRRVYYFEEPVFGMTDIPRLHQSETLEGIQVVVPHLPSDMETAQVEAALKDLVDELIFEENLLQYVAWYYTPKALPFTRHLIPYRTVFDCMDEFSLSKEASQELTDLETELMGKSDLVLTEGRSFYEAKRHSHPNIHAVPSSVDYGHFSQGRLQLVEPDDQVNISHPRIGFYGVIDEHFDMALLGQMAEKKPELQFIIIGPVLGIDPETLPQRHNIFYLGKKDYHVLPLYLAGWDCAILPFIINESTKLMSPTKTPEYLASGKPVVSTAIPDVIHPYKEKDLVHIASSPDEFLNCIERAMNERVSDPEWLDKIDWFLSNNSWDITFAKIAQLEKEIQDPPSGHPSLLTSLQETTLTAGSAH